MKNHPPLVSVLVPCRNEEHTIILLLDSLRTQNYPLENMEILVCDGLSEDSTRARVAEYMEAHTDTAIRLIENPGRTAPAALNAGLKVAKGEIILRMDAHSLPAENYIQQSVEIMQSTGCDGVGGQWDILPGAEGFWPRAIAVAAANPFGAGGARYRSGGKPGEVETVPFGVYKRAVFDRIGWFNERVPVNEDFEFNHRLRKAGAKLYFSPVIRARYLARATLSALAVQYFRYGRQKAVMLSFHPQSIKFRQAIPALFILSSIVLAVAALGATLPMYLLAAIWVAYLAVAAYFAALDAVKRKSIALYFALPAIFLLMHASWGIGFWVGWLWVLSQTVGGLFSGAPRGKEK